MVPAAIQLCKDPVAVVRVAAADQMGQLLASEEEGARLRAEILSKSLRVLSNDPVFHMRQVYIYMCYRLIGPPPAMPSAYSSYSMLFNAIHVISDIQYYSNVYLFKLYRVYMLFKAIR